MVNFAGFSKKILFVFRELSERTVNGDVYRAAIRRAARQLRDRDEDIIFLHDNARPHTANDTQKLLDELDWEVLSHPPYSPDIAPSDFHLFRSLKKWLKGRRFGSIDEVREGIQQYFDSKDLDFYQRGINNLVDRWEQVVAFDGDYCN